MKYIDIENIVENKINKPLFLKVKVKDGNV